MPHALNGHNLLYNFFIFLYKDVGGHQDFYMIMIKADMSLKENSVF